jgi:RNA methyltransferase, TrmH family
MNRTRRPAEDPQTGLPETKICGLHACRAVFLSRPADILRVYVREDRVAALGDVLSSLAKERRSYKLSGNEDLERLTDSTHHEGVCFVVRGKREPTLDELLRTSGSQCLLALTDVANPHNVGAILRTAAHFGARGVILGQGARVTPAAMRTAQGGAEAVAVLSTNDWSETLLTCRSAGYALCATSSHAPNSLYETQLPAKLVVLVGSEAQGLPAEVQELADLIVAVPGTGRVESLNVAAATAVVLGELWRQQRQKQPAASAATPAVRPARPAAKPSGKPPFSGGNRGGFGRR